MRALAVSAGGQLQSYGANEIDARTGQIAAGLHDRGVSEGQVVLVSLPKGLTWLCTMRALFRLGAISLPCPAMLTAADIQQRVDRSGAVLALVAEAGVPHADGPAPAPQLDESAPAFLLYTSGTEGPPKGALHPRAYIAANRLQIERWMGVRAGDRVWCTAASGWSKSLRNVWLAAELTDAEAVIHEGRFDPAERLELIGRLRPQVLCMAPTEYRMCARSAEFGRVKLDGVREAVAAGEALDAATVEAWESAHGIRVRDGYGQTETGAIAGVCTGERLPAGSMGRPLPGVETRITDGELSVRAATLPTLFAGYWRDAAATAERLRDGWWHTGDLVSADDEGLLWYVGRGDDVISSAGYRIGPGEVEEALRTHPAVLEAAAVGIPDPDRGQIVHVEVVLRPGFVAADSLADELRLHARTVTAPYKAPRSIGFAESLPRTTTGKVRRAAIRERIGLLP